MFNQGQENSNVPIIGSASNFEYQNVYTVSGKLISSTGDCYFEFFRNCKGKSLTSGVHCGQETVPFFPLQRPGDVPPRNFTYLFICGLFNGTVTNSEYIASNDRMISK
jgi:hypothetical protein